MNVRSDHGCHFARNPNHTQAVGPIGSEPQLVPNVLQAERLEDRLAQGQSGRQDHDSFRFDGETEFFCRAEHPHRLAPANLGLLDLEITGENRTDPGERNQVAGSMVLGSANDLQGFAAGIDLTERQPVGFRVLIDGKKLRHHHAIQTFADFLHRIDLKAGHGQSVGKLLRGEIEIDVLFEPFVSNDHLFKPFIKKGSSSH